MKIIIATPLYPPEIENLATYSQTLAQKLSAAHQVTVLAYAGQVEKTQGVKILTVNKQQTLAIRILKYTIQLLKISHRQDIIYVQNAVASGLPAIITKFLRKTPVVVNFSEDEAWKQALNFRLTDKSLSEFLANPIADKKMKRLVKIQAWVLTRANKIVVPTKVLAKVVKENYKVSEDKIIINPNPDKESLELPFEVKVVPKQIFINTKLFIWNKVDEIIKKFKDFKLIIAGDGPAKDNLKKLAKELNVTDKIIFKGRVSQAENQYLTQTSQVVSSTEGITEVVKNSWADHLTKLNNVFKNVR